MLNKIDYAIRENNIDKFIRLGNMFPNIEIWNNLHISLPPDLKTLITIISRQNPTSFYYMYSSKSRIKTLSTLSLQFIETYGIQKLSSGIYIPNHQCITQLARIIDVKFYKKWYNIWNTFSLRYDPIKPYDMSISENRKEQHGGSTNISRDSRRTTDTETKNTVVDDITDNSVYGFNSDVAVPSDKTVNNSEENYTDDTTITDTSELSTRHGRSVDEDKTISRTGNIGNITQQELITKERELQEQLMINIMFKDLDSVFTRSKYKI